MNLLSKKLLSTKEAAEVLVVSPQGVRVWCKKGFIKTYRSFGGQYRIKPIDLIEFAKSHKMFYDDGSE